MNETMVDLHRLVTFVTVAEEASFSNAAARLGISKGTVSRQIVELEAQVGVELLHRTTRRVALSTAGAELYGRVHAHISELRRAIAVMPERHEAPSGLLRITGPPDVGALLLPEVLIQYHRRYPNVRFDIRLSRDYVDLVREGFDLAIRVTLGPLKDSSLTLRRLCRHSAQLFASPAYLAEHGRPTQLGDAHHTWIVHPTAVRLFPESMGDATFTVDDFLLIRDLLRGGIGVGPLPSFVARADVREGKLVPVELADLPVITGEIVLLYPTSGQVPRKVTSFRDAMVAALGDGL